MERAEEDIQFVIVKQNLGHILSFLLTPRSNYLSIIFPLAVQGNTPAIAVIDDDKSPSAELLAVLRNSNSEILVYFLQISSNYFLITHYFLLRQIKGHMIALCRESDRILLQKVFKKLYQTADKKRIDPMQRFYISVLLQLVNEIISRDSTFRDREELLAKDFLRLFSIEIFPKHQVRYYAERLFVSRRYLTHAVHKFQGENPKAIIDRQIMNKAKELLATREAIYSIAEQLGFESPASFTTFFKKHEGCTPSSYRIQ